MTPLPESLRAEVEAVLAGGTGEAGRPGRGGAGRRPESIRIARAEAVAGGSINRAARLETDAGETLFLKWNASDDPRMFDVEAEGLRALAEAGTLRVPVVVARGDGTDGAPGWLLLEWVGPGRPGPGYAERLGRGLAELHRHAAGHHTPSWGWSRDNFIGSLPQGNEPRADWPTFWREMRLEPQLRLAREGGFFTGDDGRLLDDVLARVDDAVADAAAADGPSLLHGDLWGGNVHADEHGAPVLVDPAVYRGHREVDLAMSELFGGFPAGFLDAYDDAWPLADGYPEVRRPLYQLYYLLVHVNLFGAGYVGRTRSAARAVLAGL